MPARRRFGSRGLAHMESPPLDMVLTGLPVLELSTGAG